MKQITNKDLPYSKGSSVQFGHSVMSDSLWHHARSPCPSPTPRAYTNSSLLSWWCQSTSSFSVFSFYSRLQSFPASVSFQMSVLHMRYPKYWGYSFSISPSKEHSGLICFRVDWFDLLAVQGTLKNLLQHQFKNSNFSGLSFLYIPTFTSIYDYWKNHSFN